MACTGWHSLRVLLIFLGKFGTPGVIKMQGTAYSRFFLFYFGDNLKKRKRRFFLVVGNSSVLVSVLYLVAADLLANFGGLGSHGLSGAQASLCGT